MLPHKQTGGQQKPSTEYMLARRHGNKKFSSYLKENESNAYSVGFEVLTAASMKLADFWVAASCSLVEVYQRFRGT
jgi:hypothetical protein